MKRKPVEMIKGWEHVEEGFFKLRKIIEGEPETHFSSEEYMILYTKIYNMCTKKPSLDSSQEVYDKFTEIVDDYISSRVAPSLSGKRDEYLLRELAKWWSNHKLMIKWLSRFFGYLDRYFITRRNLPPLSIVGSYCFRNSAYSGVQDRTAKAVIALINREREGELIDRSLLKGIVEIFIEVGLGKMKQYECDFEMWMLANTFAYYKSKAINWIEVYTCSEYIQKAEQCLRRERERVFHYLHSSTEQKLIEIVKQQLLVNCETQLLEKENSGFLTLLRDDKVDDLHRIYRLYQDIDGGLEPIANLFKEHIIAVGTSLFQEIEEVAEKQAGNSSSIHEHIVIRKVIEVHDRFMAYVNNCFANHSMFHKALNEAFEFFCNKTIAGYSSAEFFTTFCDNVLKKWRHERMTDEATEETLNKVIKLLVHINDKDTFAEFYRKKLARRLLFIRNISDELEKSFVIKLKEQLGMELAGKMENMIYDLVVMTKESRNQFEKYVHDNQLNFGMDFSVTVITLSAWPNYKTSDLNLPSEMIKCMESYKGFYEAERRGRRLTWVNSLGTCNVNGHFERKSIELVVSTYQAVVLLMFNNADRLRYSEIEAQLKLNNEDLVRVLYSLSCTKYKILNKEPSTKAISPNDTFEFNSKFTDNMNKIKIPLPAVCAVSERKKTLESVEHERRCSIDAALVRIMKVRKALNHQHLLSECISHLSPTFKPEIKDIKKRIEGLIARDYLERDRHNPNTIKYMA